MRLIYIFFRNGIEFEITNTMNAGVLIIKISPDMYQEDIHSKNKISFSSEV